MHKVATVEDQGVRAALLTVGDSEIELLEPLAPTSGIGKFLAKRGEGLHHLCYATADVAVWDRNMYAIPTAELKDLRCEMTLVRGRVVYAGRPF